MLVVFVISGNSTELIYGNILRLPSHMYAAIVSKSYQKMIIIKMENGYPVVADQFIAVTGLKFGDKRYKGDMRTPSGVYFPVSFKPERILPSYFGKGAYPLNYPNALDKYIIHRDGDGIWIHGSNEKKLLFFSSKGCVILNNKDFSELEKYVVLKKTPVIIQERFVKLKIDEFNRLKEKIDNFIDQWEKALLQLYARNTTAIENFYSDNFKSEKGSKHDLINSYKSDFVVYGDNKPLITDFNRMIFYDKRNNGMEYFVVSLNLAYLSGDEIKSLKKILYLTVENKKLKIITEETIK